MTWRRWLPVLAALTLFAGGPGTASAQLDQSVQARQDPQAMLADQLVLLVRDALDGEGMPGRDQLIRANAFLQQATELAPDRVELWRLQADLAELRGDRDARRRALAQIIKLDPRDDAAQLRLILDGIDRLQTLEERLATVERFLDAPAAAGLSAPLRSRLASYAAAAAREIGDDRKFARRLTQSLELDTANGDAGRMAYELAARRNGDRLALGTGAIVWTRSDPTNPAPRLALAEILFDEGAYAQAAQQYDMAVAFAQTMPTQEQIRLWATSLALSGQPDAALGLLGEIERSLTPADVSSEGATAGGVSPQLELLRVAIVALMQSPEAAQPHYERLRAALRPLAEAGDAAAQRELAIAAAVFSQDLDAAEAQLGDAADDDARNLVRGWVALRYGRLEQGEALLRPLAEQSALARLGLALLASEPAAKASALQALVREDRKALPALLAGLNLRKLGMEPQATPVAQSLRKVMEGTPARVWSSRLATEPWIGVRFAVTPGRVGYLQPLTGTISLQNLAGVPLAVGQAGSVPGQAFVSIEPNDAGQPLRPLPPLVVDLARRITLAPGERYHVDFRVDHSPLGDLFAMNPGRPLAFNATTIVDPKPTPQGTVRPGALGGIDSVRAIQLAQQPATSENVAAWLAALDGSDAAVQLAAIARLLRAMDGDLAEGDRDRIADVIASRYRGFDPLRQAWIMRFLPSAARRPDALQRIVEFALRSEDPVVRLVYISTHVTDEGDPALTAALRSEDPLIGEFARAYREALRKRAEASEPSSP